MKLKKALLISLAGFFIGFLMLQSASTAKATIIESTFDSDLEGWTITHGTAAWQDDSPDPHAGYLEATDTDGDRMWVHAPGKFLGNLSSFSGGTIGFDSMYTTANSSPIVRFGEISLTNGGTTITRDIVPDPLTATWKTYEYSLGYSDWGFANEGSWQTFLGNITAIGVNLESHTSVVEVVGFDNFNIRNGNGPPVPEPSAILLLGFGLVGLLGIGKKKLGK